MNDNKNRIMVIFRNILSCLITALISIQLLIIVSGCGRHNVLLQAPELKDNTPALATGFYTVHTIDASAAVSSQNESFLGTMLYLYKDQFFIDGSFFTGIKGSFLPGYYISSRIINGQLTHYWYDGEDEDKSGTVLLESVNRDEIIMGVMTPTGKTEKVLLRYYAPHIWKPEVKTITIAHRGLCYQPPSNYEGIYPANTIPGFENALRAGYEGFELDVRLTKDKFFIVSHDEDLRVATTVRGTVAEKNLADFKEILVVQSAPIPEQRSSARPAYIAAPMVSLKEVLDEFLDDDRLHTIVVDIKPDNEEDLIRAAAHDFTGLDASQQKKILFLTRTEGVARGLKKIAPEADIAIEGSIGTEPVDEEHWFSFYPEAVGKPRQSHNTVSFGSNWILALESEEESRLKLNMVDSICQTYDYKQCYWTFAKDWRINFLRTNNLFPDYILLDVPYYKMGLQQLRYTKGRDLDLPEGGRPFIELDRYPVYKNIIDQNVHDFWFKSRQMYEIHYGAGVPRHSDLQGDLAPVGQIELKIGRSEIDKFSEANVELSDRYLFISFLNSSLHPVVPGSNEITTESARFGIGTTDGIGYTAGHDFSLSPTVGQALVWTRLNEFAAEDELSPEDIRILNRYPGRFRFGDRATYGLKAEITSLLQLSAYYETAVVFPRHMFWYWSGSFIISQAGYGLLSHFTDTSVNRNQIFGPVTNFVLKSLYLYGFYLLRKDDMNWPFETEAPLRFETANIGFSLVF